MAEIKTKIISANTIALGQDACAHLLRQMQSGELPDEHVGELANVLGVPPDEVGDKLVQLLWWSAAKLNPTQPQVPFPIKNQQQPDLPADL